MRVCGEALAPHAQSLVALLDDAAQRAPQRAFVVERDAREVWHELTFARAAERARRVAAGLLALGGAPSRPVLLLGGDGVDGAVVTLGAWCAGIPVVPVALDVTLPVLRAIVERVRPAVVFASDPAAVAPLLRAVLAGAALVAVREPPRDLRAHDLARLLAYEPLREAPPIDAETPAKITFTVDAAGAPCGAVTTHGMLCAQQQALTQAWPFLAERPPVLAGTGALLFGIALRHAGTLYVHESERAAGVSPTLACDVPAGWNARLARLRADDALRRQWTERLDRACWTGAPLAPATRDGLRAIGMPLAGAWGAAETAGPVTLTRRVDPRHDAIGVPLAGVELKLVPRGDAFEVRVRGPQVMPGYYWDAQRTAAAFDEDGFLRTGDLARTLVPRAPQRGLAFAGRIDERFKLSSARWVRGAAIRAAFLAACPDAGDAAVSGAGRDRVGLLVWPSAQGRMLARDVLRAQIAAAMRQCAGALGADERPQRALIVDVPAHDRLRAALVARLHASEPDGEVIVV